jgi:hypothetical protein
MLPRPTQIGRSGAVDSDAGSMAALRAYRAVGGLLGRPRTSSGTRRSARHPRRDPPAPERFSRRFAGQVVPARKALEEQLPVIRLHDLRHTHATPLLADGVPVKVVSERLGHASAAIALTVYQHVHPGMGREAAYRFADRPSAHARSEALDIARDLVAEREGRGERVRWSCKDPQVGVAGSAGSDPDEHVVVAGLGDGTSASSALC